MTHTPILNITGTCQFKGCNEPATAIASGRREWQSKPTYGAYDIGLFCYAHAEAVADFDQPEYQTACPNCGCIFGVN